MSSYQLTIENHPSQAAHPFTGEPLFDDDGKPVPLFPDQRSIRLDGRVIAYVANGNAMFIVPRESLGVIADEAVELAASIGAEQTHFVPQPKEPIEVDDEE